MHALTLPRRIAGALAVAALVAACSSGATVAPTTAPAQSSSAGGGSGAALTVNAKQGSAGAYLTDASGKSLYIRTTDSNNTTTCTGACATNWPPLVLQAGQAVQPGAGVTGTLGSFARPDGSTQVTLNGMPLYFFAGDTAAGQTNGQGLQGIWFLAAPAGGTVGGPGAPGAASPAMSPASTKSGGGYGY
jgi:predicted lipoprotein with Yx(FWY)xxD motif